MSENVTDKTNLQLESSKGPDQARFANSPIAARVAGLSVERLKLLGREIKNKNKTTGISIQAESTAKQATPLVPIRIAESRVPPLFLIHPVGGGVVAYHTLAKYLQADQPVYALQNLDCGGNESRDFASIEDMASRYIELIKTVQPDGPYFLGGSSMGGAVAFEMAVQLKARGGRVSLVAMLDTPARITPHMDGQAGNSQLAV